MTITKQLQENVRVDLRQEPNIQINFELLKIIKKDLKNKQKNQYTSQIKGIINLISILEETNLKYIPTDVLRNKLSPLKLYTELVFIDKNEDILDIFENVYEQSLITLNYFIDLKDI